MLSTTLRNTIIALFASVGLIVTAACDPADFEADDDTDQPPAQQTEPMDPAIDQDDPQQQEDPEDVRGIRQGEPAEPAADDLEGAWDNTLQGIEEMRTEVERQAREAGEDVDDALEEFDENVQDFEEDIQNTLDDYMDADPEDEMQPADPADEPGMDDDTGMDDEGPAGLE